MLPAIGILIMAWTIGGVISELGTGRCQPTLGTTHHMYPALIFVLAGIIAFSTGAGTFAIMIPIAVDFASVWG